MRIVLTSNSSWTIYQFRIDLIKHLLKSHEIFIVAPEDEKTEYLKQLPIKFYKYSLNAKGINPVGEYRVINKLKLIYEKIKPDIIFHYTIKPIIWGTIAAKKLGIHNIAVTTGLGYAFNENNLVAKTAKKLYKMSLKGANHVWFLNKNDQSKFVNQNLVESAKTMILPSEGINLAEYNPVVTKKNEAFHFLFIGRMLKTKGITELINAFNILSKRTHKPVVLNLLGFLNAANRNAISQQQMDVWVKHKQINYLSSVDDVKPIIIKNDCIVLPSYSEGISRVLLEACAMQKPIICTDVPGCNEVVIDGYNGLLCQVKNAQDLADKMEQMLLLTDEQRATMGKNGRKLMKEKFDQNIVFKFYEEAIANFIN